METALLATKLYVPPRRPNWVVRPRLLNRMNASLRGGCKLTLVAAPAGFGKTTLVTEWLAALGEGQPAAWLSLDARDNDLAVFTHYLVAALQTCCPQVGAQTLNLLGQAHLPPAEALLLPLVNDLARQAGPLVLVLDDYHAIQQAAVHEALSWLIEHQPPALHVVITTRQDPLLPLSRWRARGLLAEIRLRDLRFSVEETGAFLNGTMGLDLNPEAVAALESRTEGWIAGLQLAAVSLLQAGLEGDDGAADFVASFTGNDRYVMDYLIDEVLDRQPEAVQRFLLQTAVLERFNAGLCRALLAGDEAPGGEPPGLPPEAVLQHLEQANLFLIALDSQREWFRYHHLFAELLQRRLAAGGLPGLPEGGGQARIAALQRRASDWFAGQGMAGEAIHYAQAAGDWPLSSALLARFGPPLIKRGQHAQVLRWFAGLPESVVRQDPVLCRTFGYLLTLTGKLDQGAQYLNQALQYDRRDPHHQGLTLAFASYNACFRADFGEEIEMAQRALSLLPPGADWERGIAAISLGLGLCHTDDPHGCEAAMREAYEAGRKSGTMRTCFYALTYLGRLSVLRLEFGKAQEEFEQACSLQIDDQRYRGCDVALFDLAQLKYEQNELGLAQHYLERGMEDNQISGSIEMRAYGLRLAARLCQLRGEAAQAQEFLAQALALAHTHNLSPLTLNLNAAMRMLMALDDGLLGEAERAASDLAVAAGAKPAGLYPFNFQPELARVQLHLRLGRRAEALRELEPVLWRALQPGWAYPRVQVRLLQALAETSPAGAHKHLREALALAAPAHAARCFLDLGEPLRALLAGLQPQLSGGEAAFAGAVLQAFGRPESGSPTAETLVEPLTERELEVLRLLAEGLSNLEIAGRLVLSPNTLKAHTQNIYSKMDVHSRVQLVNKARALGLLPDG